MIIRGRWTTSSAGCLAPARPRVPPLTIVKTVADAAIEAVGESLEETAAGLRAAADDFESSDAEQAAHIRTVETGLA